MHWEQLSPHLFRFHDSCIVYAIIGDDAAIVVNAGSGAWIDYADELPLPVSTVFCTHYFRDHTAGAARAIEAGIEVAASYWEQELLVDARGHFSRRETYIIYDNIWDLFGPIENIAADTWLMDWERVRTAGLELTVVPTPGVTPGAVSFLVDVDGSSMLFCGEVIHSFGKLARVAPLQYNYNDLPGAISLAASIADIRRLGPDILAPSMGPALIENPDEALSALRSSLRELCEGRPGYLDSMDAAEEDAVDEITPHLYKSRHSVASSYFLVSQDGSALSIDYGYHGRVFQGAAYPFFRNRRSRLHGIEALRRETGVNTIDTVLVTHFHDDHVAGIPLLQRLYGTKCWAGENFASILHHPEGYAFPCTWPEDIAVEPKPLGKPFRWKEYEFVLYPMSGHTRFSTAVQFNVDGETVLATGDQYFLQNFDPEGTSKTMHNHVYRNGAVFGSFAQSMEMLDAVAPTLILPGHGDAYRYTSSVRERFAEYSADYQRLHRAILPTDEPNFDVDARAAWLTPYRSVAAVAGPVELGAYVRNPFDHEETLTVHLVAGNGAVSSPKTITLKGKGEGSLSLTIDLTKGRSETMVRRMPVALEMRSQDRIFGQVAEALVTIGHRLF